MVKSGSSKDVLWYFWDGFKVVLLFFFIPLLSSPLFHHFNPPKIEHQCLTFNFNLDLDHSTQKCNTSELDFMPLTKHCRRVAYLCKHGPCSVGFDASSLCLCLFWTATAWSFRFLTLGKDRYQPFVQTTHWNTLCFHYLWYLNKRHFHKGKSGKLKWSPNKWVFFLSGCGHDQRGCEAT